MNFRKKTYVKLLDWVKRKRIPIRLKSGVDAIIQLYQDGYIHNFRTAQNQVNNLLTSSNPQKTLLNNLVKFITKEPIQSRNQKKRLDKLVQAINKKTTKPKKTLILNFLGFKAISKPEPGEKVKKLYIDKRPIEWDCYQQVGGNYQITIEATEDEINKLYELNNIFVSYNLDFEDFEFSLEILKRECRF